VTTRHERGLIRQSPDRGGQVTSNVRPPKTVHIRSYRSDEWMAMCEIYNLSKPDELLGVVDAGSISSLEADSGIQALFRGSQILAAQHLDCIAALGGNRGSLITWLFVHPAFPRRGVATALVRDMLARMQQPVTLNVMVSNIPAHALYERIGFGVERAFQGNLQGRTCSVTKLRYETAA
jgi:ribosomal protein S18 acetylase RimI-like enzyme